MNFETSDMYRSLRGRLFLTNPESIGVVSNGEQRFWGLMIDFGIEEGVATLVVLRDGSISLYSSKGGGLIGLGIHDELHPPADRLLDMAEQFSLEGPEAERDTLPEEGVTRFNFLGFNGARSVEESDEDLDAGTHALSPLWNAAHELLEAIENVDNRRR